MEHALWGIPKNDRKMVRPSYGYLHPNAEAVFPDETPWDYGDIAVRFKRDILQRTTFTVGDTLDQVTVPDALNQARKPLRPRFVPSWVSNPSWLAVPLPMGDALEYLDAQTFVRTTLSTSPRLHYVEAQYHGPVTLADVEEVIFLRKPPSEEIRRLLDEKGVRYKEPRQDGK